MNGWKKAVTTAAVATSLTAAVGALAATNDIFAKIGDIKGESTDLKHKGEIDVISWSWGLVQMGAGHSNSGGGGVGKAQFHDISIVKKVDRASPALLQAAAEGSHIRDVQLIVRKAGGRQLEYLKIKLTDVFVASVLNVVKGEEAVEHLTLNFGKVEYDYYPQKEDGSADAPVHFGWSVKDNRKQ